MSETESNNHEIKYASSEFSAEEALWCTLHQLNREFGIPPQSLTSRELLHLSAAARLSFAEMDRYQQNINKTEDTEWPFDPDKEAVHRWFQDLYGIDEETLDKIRTNYTGVAVVDPRTGEVFSFSRDDYKGILSKQDEIFSTLTPEEKKKFHLDNEVNLSGNILKDEDRRYIELLRERARNQSENDD